MSSAQRHAAWPPVLREHTLDDLAETTLLPHLAAPGVREQCQPRLHAQSVTREAAVGLARRRCSDDAAARDLAAVAERDVQRGGLRKHRLHIEVGAQAQGADVQLSRLAQTFAQAPGFDHQLAELAVAFQAKKARAGVERVLQRFQDGGEWSPLSRSACHGLRDASFAGHACALPQ